jgi:hypothetical protein
VGGKRKAGEADSCVDEPAPPATAKAGKETKAARPSSKKRKSETSIEDDIAQYKKNLDHIDVEGMPIDLTCNQVRGRINKLIDGGIMKKGEFCNAIGNSNAAVNTFLKKAGSMDGAGSEVYANAWAWFKQREMAGLKMPDVKKKQAAQAAAATGSAAGAALPSAPRASVTCDISAVELDGEETDSVDVYDSCDEVRKKISAHLQTPGLTQAQFCRDLYAQLHAPSCKSIQSKQLNDFRAKRGARDGCTSSVYYAAYVYFEKLRLAQGKPMSKHRKEMESIWPGGVDRKTDGRHG